jgi:hypothetical protein
MRDARSIAFLKRRSRACAMMWIKWARLSFTTKLAIYGVA